LWCEEDGEGVSLFGGEWAGGVDDGLHAFRGGGFVVGARCLP
jgi:hypothetical protein